MPKWIATDKVVQLLLRIHFKGTGTSENIQLTAKMDLIEIATFEESAKCCRWMFFDRSRIALGSFRLAYKDQCSYHI
tara:strand:- start:1357 stop:1587 length:231 start_codon:yes stop_codon:yes gene_type:complete